MNGCIYRTEDNKCEFWSDYGKGIVSYCDFDDCEEKKPTNADHIRAMTDEELLKFLQDVALNIKMCEIMRTQPMWISIDWLKSLVEDREVDK